MADKKQKPKIKVAVIGSSRYEEIDEAHQNVAYNAGKAIADNDCILLTGGGRGISEFAVNGARENGGFCIGISPADSDENHVTIFKNPSTIFDTLIFTGFGHKGRNVVLIRSCDVVVACDGGVGTLNELTIALDEGKNIGILNSSGPAITHFLDFYNEINGQRKFDGSLVVKDRPEELIKTLIELHNKKSTRF